MSDERGTLISIQAGRIESHGSEFAANPLEKKWISAIVKSPVSGDVKVTRLGLEGDEQADKKHHGGPDKALLAYPAEHYDYWRREYPERNWIFGGFGENLTLTGFTEESVCIGDVFRLGGKVIVQASEPRQPCYKLARRWNWKEMAEVVMKNGYSGWYFRVLEEGVIKAGAAVERIDHPYPEWNTAYVNFIIRHVGDDFDRAERLSQCPPLSESLRRFFRKAIDNHRPSPIPAPDGFPAKIKRFLQKRWW
ncbi:MAG: MOSC domain-containing protein [bacterium]|nr:MOSC domain-containing protein [bacterium]